MDFRPFARINPIRTGREYRHSDSCNGVVEGFLHWKSTVPRYATSLVFHLTRFARYGFRLVAEFVHVNFRNRKSPHIRYIIAK